MILFVNVSPKREKSNSCHFLNMLKEQLEEECEYIDSSQLKETTLLAVKMDIADAVVIGMPVYVDSVPAQFVEMMEELYADFVGEFAQMPVYVIANGGFYESRQMETLFEIIENWCIKMKFNYGGGLAIGAGEMLGGLSRIPWYKKLNTRLENGISQLAEGIRKREPVGNLFIEPPLGYTKGAYILGAHLRWQRIARQNNLSGKDLRKRW